MYKKMKNKKTLFYNYNLNNIGGGRKRKATKTFKKNLSYIFKDNCLYFL